MNTPEVITTEVCVTAITLGAGAYLLVRRTAKEALMTWHMALKEGWVRGSANFGFVAPGKRFEPTPKTSAAVAADHAPATAADTKPALRTAG